MLDAIKLPAILTVLLVVTAINPALAQKAPAFSLKGDKGNVTLSTYKNKVVYVDFWASWCKPCRKSFPFMNEMQARYAKQGLQIIGINLDNDKQAARDFLKKNPAEFTIAYDPDGKTPGLYNLKVMPTSYLIDRKGNLVHVHKGFKENQKQKMEALILKTLKK